MSWWRPIAATLAAVLTIAFASSALAQITDIRVGPFRMGMSLAEANAVRSEVNPNARAVVSTASLPNFQLADRAYRADLLFVGGALERVRLEGYAGGRSTEACFGALAGLVSALEPTTGPLNGAAQAGEASGQRLESVRTSGGSEIHRYGGEGAGVGVARTDGASNVVARVLVLRSGRTFSCVLMVIASNASEERPQGLDPAPTADELTAATPIERPQWLQRPDPRVIADLYPEAAAEQNVEGRVELDCIVKPDGGLRCAVALDAAPGFGFARTALLLAGMMRMAPTIDGAPTEGRRVHQNMRFALP